MIPKISKDEMVAYAEMSNGETIVLARGTTPECAQVLREFELEEGAVMGEDGVVLHDPRSGVMDEYIISCTLANGRVVERYRGTQSECAELASRLAWNQRRP